MREVVAQDSVKVGAERVPGGARWSVHYRKGKQYPQSEKELI